MVMSLIVLSVYRSVEYVRRVGGIGTFIIIMNSILNHKAQLFSLILGVEMTYLSFTYLVSKH